MPQNSIAASSGSLDILLRYCQPYFYSGCTNLNKKWFGGQYQCHIPEHVINLPVRHPLLCQAGIEPVIAQDSENITWLSLASGILGISCPHCSSTRRLAPTYTHTHTFYPWASLTCILFPYLSDQTKINGIFSFETNIEVTTQLHGLKPQSCGSLVTDHLMCSKYLPVMS